MSNFFDFGLFGMGQLVFGFVFVMSSLAVCAVIIALIVAMISEKRKNDSSPRLTVDAAVATKRTDVTTSSHANAGDISGAHGFHHHTTTWYYVTFEVESGDRLELAVDGRQYGQLAEGDVGRLSFQGRRFISFEREPQL